MNNKIFVFAIFLSVSIFLLVFLEKKENTPTIQLPPIQLPPPTQQQLPPPPEIPPKAILTNFEAYPQQGGTTCGPVAVRNILKHMTGQLYTEARLSKEVIEEDHKGLEFLREDLKQIGIRNPESLSKYGTTPVGNTAVLNRYLPPNMEAKYQEIPKLEDRLTFIVNSIANGRPVMVPFTKHWTVAIGYDLTQERLVLVNAGVGDSTTRPEGGTYCMVDFATFDHHNSFKDPQSGTVKKVLDLANEKGLGRWVLVYIDDR